MKLSHESVEEVAEYAKHLILSGRGWQLEEDQHSIFSNQHFKQLVVQRAGYEYAVTDSPLPIVGFYAPAREATEMRRLAFDRFSHFDNINFLLTRPLHEASQPYESRGRVQSRDEAVDVGNRLREYLLKNGVEFEEVPAQADTPWRLFEKVLGKKPPVELALP